MPDKLTAAIHFSKNKTNKRVPHGKRKHTRIRLSPLNDDSATKHNLFDNKYSVLPKIGVNTTDLLKQHGKAKEKHAALEKIAEINGDDYFNSMEAHSQLINVKDLEKKLGISSNTKHRYYINKSPNGGKTRKNKNKIRVRKHRSTQRRK